MIVNRSEGHNIAVRQMAYMHVQYLEVCDPLNLFLYFEIGSLDNPILHFGTGILPMGHIMSSQKLHPRKFLFR